MAIQNLLNLLYGERVRLPGRSLDLGAIGIADRMADEGQRPHQAVHMDHKGLLGNLAHHWQSSLGAAASEHECQKTDQNHVNANVAQAP